MNDRAKTDKSTKRNQILRCGKQTAAIVHARAKERGIGIYQAAEELIAIGQKRVDALAAYSSRRKTGEV